MDQEEMDRLKVLAETNRREAYGLGNLDKREVFGSSIRSIRERSATTADTNLRSPNSSRDRDGEES